MAARTSKPGSTPSASGTGAARCRIRYIVNSDEKRLEVVLPIRVYERLMKELEDLTDFRDAQFAWREGKWESLDEVKRRLGP